MFNSISNNFGAGTIQFKEVRESNYLILNAKFTYNTTNAAYLAADVLEITVPDLPFERSAVAGVFLRFADRGTSYGYPYVSDGGTVLKTWIKDKNTICIEKITTFDEHEEMIIYMQTLFCQLAQGSNAIKASTTTLTFKQAEKQIYMGYNNVCIIFDKWVFLHLEVSSIAYAFRNYDVKVFMDGFPLDVDTEMVLGMDACYKTTKAGGMDKFTIKDGCLFLKKEDRNDGFDNTGNYIFAFGYLIRNREIPVDVEGRLHIAENPMKGNGYVQMSLFDLEVQQKGCIAAITGSTGQYSTSYCILYPVSVPEGMPKFKSYILGRVQNGSGLCVQLDTMTVDPTAATPVIQFDNVTGGNNIVVKIFDTGAAIQL